LEILPITIPVKTGKFDLYQSFKISGFEFEENDILVVSSKYISMSEGSLLKIDRIKSSKKARILGAAYHIDEKIVEITLREADYIFKGVPGFLLSIKDDILAPNAGIDRSNVPSGYVVIYPRLPFKTADNLRRRFLIDMGLNIGIVIADSRLMPGRIGTIGVAIANAGFEPTEDERGNIDLFGRVLRVSFRAVADTLATMAVAVMGEGDESIPAAVIRGVNVTRTDRKLSSRDMTVDADQDLYLRGLRC
jgi:coenzyme F420-0:L-glutamate ligase / coenzyme F420-1:gamma-L-glutamate ligase